MPTGGGGSTKFEVFTISISDITDSVYQYRKNVIKLLKRISDDREIFQVYIELCNLALNQSAFRIHECYTIK